MNLQSLDDGFPLEDPPVLIPWGLYKDDLRRLLEPFGLLESSSRDHLALSCTALNGLPVNILFCFHPNYREQKYELSFGRVNQLDLRESFEDFQRHLEETFGTPMTITPGEFGYPHYEWMKGIYTVSHGVYEYHSLIEYVVIRPPNRPSRLATGLVRLINLTFELIEFVPLPVLLFSLFVFGIVLYLITGQAPRLW